MDPPPGASPPMRMTESWLGSNDPTAYKSVARRCALMASSPRRRQDAKLCYRFGPLTPSARSANLIAGDGTKNGFPAPNKEPTTNQKLLLDRKSPIQDPRWRDAVFEHGTNADQRE